jgi:hypothetical protein
MLKLFYKLVLFSLLVLSITVLYQKHTYAYHTLTHINPIPQTKTLIAEEHYVDAHKYLSYFMQFDYMKENTEAQQLLKEIDEKRSSLAYKSGKFVEGFTTGMSDEFIGQASAIGSDFLLIGDLRDLALEGTHYYKDEEVDTVLVSLSTIGLVASVSTLFTLGSSAVAKSGVSVLKLAHKSKRIPTWLGTYLTKQAKQIRQTKNIDSIKPLFNHLDEMHKNTGLSDTLKLLSQTHNLKELQTTAKLTKRYGQDTTILLKLSNKTLLTESKTLKKVDIKTIKLASTYGTSGLVHLIKGGEKNFIKTTKRIKAYSKVGYKGEIWKMFLSLMEYLSDTVLMIIMGIASLLLFPFRKRKRIL